MQFTNEIHIFDMNLHVFVLPGKGYVIDS